MSVLIANVALVNRPLFDTYDYRLILKGRKSAAECAYLKGARVLVPFGKSISSLAVIVSLKDHALQQSATLKEAKLLDETGLMGEDVFESVLFGARYYHYPLGQCFFTALPLALREGKSCELARVDLLMLCEDAPARLQKATGKPRIKSPAQLKLLSLLSEEAAGTLAIPVTEARDRGIPPHAITALLDKKLIRRVKSEIDYTTWQEGLKGGSVIKEQGPALNPGQAYAVERVASARGHETFLLYGITGSGKTEVYLRIIEKVLEKGKAALVLVPEIALTPQTFERFHRRFNVPVASLHSALSDRERFETYLNARYGKSAILIGTRSALFTPLPGLGLIVIDEEHDSSFKQGDGFRYHARVLARERARLCNCPLVLGSATPALESIVKAESGEYTRLDLTERAGGAAPPHLKLIDLTTEPLSQGMFCGIGTTLENAIGEETVKGNQVLLFLNRRGYSRHLVCHSCGNIFSCPHCDNLLTVHHEERVLSCHICEYRESLPHICPVCHHAELVETGFGTEQVEEFLKNRYPDVGVERIDRDTVKNRDELEARLEKIRRGQSQIVVGTQMLAKGHDFPDVTLVGIIDIDSGLYSDDFRSLEYTAQLITQVAGRAGRALKEGYVIVQSHHPDHELLYNLIERRSDYLPLVLSLLPLRQQLKLPPYGAQAFLESNSEDRDAAHAFLSTLLTGLTRESLPQGVTLSPVLSDKMEKRHNRFHFHILASGDNETSLAALLDKAVNAVKKGGIPAGVRFAIDVDPLLMI